MHINLFCRICGCSFSSWIPESRHTSAINIFIKFHNFKICSHICRNCKSIRSNCISSPSYIYILGSHTFIFISFDICFSRLHCCRNFTFIIKGLSSSITQSSLIQLHRHRSRICNCSNICRCSCITRKINHIVDRKLIRKLSSCSSKCYSITRGRRWLVYCCCSRCSLMI